MKVKEEYIIQYTKSSEENKEEEEERVCEEDDYRNIRMVNSKTPPNFNNTILDNAINIFSKIYGSVPVKIHYGVTSSTSGNHSTKVFEREISAKVHFSDFPANVLLQIFSYLDVYSLSKLSRVNRSWYNYLNDNLLWTEKLALESHSWERIDHLTHPDLYRETNPDLTPKEIYLRCCPECNHHQKNALSFPMQISKLSYFFGFSVPRIVMFGSGLDSSGLVKRMLWDPTSPFMVKGLFPGQFEGVGSGVTLQTNGFSIDLICLYALSKSERENQDVNAERKSRLLGENREISQSVKELCNTVDAFIYIVNGATEGSVQFGSDEFKALINDRWLQPKVPVLVLCVVPNATVQSVSALKVADTLKLLNISRPWQVRQCHVNSLYGLMPGMKWLKKHVMGL